MFCFSAPEAFANEFYIKLPTEVFANNLQQEHKNESHLQTPVFLREGSSKMQSLQYEKRQQRKTFVYSTRVQTE
jgi:hypothetical protein